MQMMLAINSAKNATKYHSEFMQYYTKWQTIYWHTPISSNHARTQRRPCALFH